MPQSLRPPTFPDPWLLAAGTALSTGAAMQHQISLLGASTAAFARAASRAVSAVQ